MSDLPDRRGKLVVEIQTNGGDDAGPMQFITQARLDYYRRVEVEWRSLIAQTPKILQRNYEEITIELAECQQSIK